MIKAGADDALQDLVFEFHLAGGDAIKGVVEYGSLTFGNPLDCNGDGVVDAADLNCVSSSEIDDLLGQLGLLEGDLDGDGDVAFADFLVLSATSAKWSAVTQRATSISTAQLPLPTSLSCRLILARAQPAPPTSRNLRGGV